MRLQLPFGIASISGKVGNVVFYSRNGKQYARRLNRHTASVEALSSECRAIIELLSGVITSPRSPASAQLPAESSVAVFSSGGIPPSLGRAEAIVRPMPPSGISSAYLPSAH